MTIHIFTSAAFNYIPKVRLLFESIKRYHNTDIRTHLLLADRPNPAINLDTEPFDDLITIDQLDIPEWEAWSFTHTIVELATALKPFALKYLLNTCKADKVIYFDPDMVLFSPVPELFDALESSDIILTPHITTAESSLQGILDNELCALKHGVYNLGFFGVANRKSGLAFADWWSTRCYFFCRDAISQGMFTDQRWIDLVPAIFNSVHILKSPRFNVAPWNENTRVLAGNFETGLMVNGFPLGFYHFTGFDSGAHEARTNLVNNPTLSNLINWYADKMHEAEKDKLATIPWGFAKFNTGETITIKQRKNYQDSLYLQRKLKNPYSHHFKPTTCNLKSAIGFVPLGSSSLATMANCYLGAPIAEPLSLREKIKRTYNRHGLVGLFSKIIKKIANF